MNHADSTPQGLSVGWGGFALLLAVLFAVSTLAKAEQTRANVTRLTFHVIAFSENGPVLGGTLEGPADNKATTVELVVQFYKTGHLLETRTLSTEALRWPKAHFKFPVSAGVDCYEIVAIRAFDQGYQLLESSDATTELLKPGRCQVRTD